MLFATSTTYLRGMSRIRHALDALGHAAGHFLVRDNSVSALCFKWVLTNFDSPKLMVGHIAWRENALGLIPRGRLSFVFV